MNNPSTNKYNFALRAVSVEGEETRAQNMRIMSRESINFFPIPQQRRSTFYRKTLLSAILNVPPLPADQVV